VLGQVRPIHVVSIEWRAGWAICKVRTRRLPHCGSQLKTADAPGCQLEISYAHATSDIRLRGEWRGFQSTGAYFSREFARSLNHWRRVAPLV